METGAIALIMFVLGAVLGFVGGIAWQATHK